MEPSEVPVLGRESRQLLPLPDFPLMPASARALEPKSSLQTESQVPHRRSTHCALHLLCASRLKPERCRVVQTGLQRTAGHPPLRLPPVTPCHPKPDRLLRQGRHPKEKPLLRDTGFRLGCRNMVGLQHLPCALTKPAPSIRVRFRSWSATVSCHTDRWQDCTPVFSVVSSGEKARRSGRWRRHFGLGPSFQVVVNVSQLNDPSTP